MGLEPGYFVLLSTNWSRLDVFLFDLLLWEASRQCVPSIRILKHRQMDHNLAMAATWPGPHNQHSTSIFYTGCQGFDMIIVIFGGCHLPVKTTRQNEKYVFFIFLEHICGKKDNAHAHTHTHTIKSVK